MQRIYWLFLLVILSCGTEPGPNETVSTTNADSTADTTAAPPDTCRLAYPTQPGNRYADLTRGEQILLRATDPGRWQLEVYETGECTLTAVYTLPPNESPDFPYYLADINYSTFRRQIGIRGYRKIFVADLDRQELSDGITPQFPGDPLVADPQSGQILRLEVWEDYLVGYAQDYGPFAYRLGGGGPRSLAPAATYAPETGGPPQALFLIENPAGTFQAILPQLDFNSGDFTINPIFPAPRALDPTATIHENGSPYARLRTESGELIGINLGSGELLPVIEKVE